MSPSHGLGPHMTLEMMPGFMVIYMATWHEGDSLLNALSFSFLYYLEIIAN